MKLFIRSCFDREAIPLPFNQEALIDIESELTNYPRLTLSSFTNKQNLVSRKDGAGKNLVLRRDKAEKLYLWHFLINCLLLIGAVREKNKTKQNSFGSNFPDYFRLLPVHLPQSELTN